MSKVPSLSYTRIIGGVAAGRVGGACGEGLSGMKAQYNSMSFRELGIQPCYDSGIDDREAKKGGDMR